MKTCLICPFTSRRTHHARRVLHRQGKHYRKKELKKAPTDKQSGEEIVGKSEADFVKGQGHKKSTEQKQYEKLKEYLNRLKKYAEQIAQRIWLDYTGQIGFCALFFVKR